MKKLKAGQSVEVWLVNCDRVVQVIIEHSDDGRLYIRPKGYGQKYCNDGEGSPIVLELWKNELQVRVAADITSSGSGVYSLEGAREELRHAF